MVNKAKADSTYIVEEPAKETPLSIHTKDQLLIISNQSQKSEQKNFMNTPNELLRSAN
jgi:hypothetical protein